MSQNEKYISSAQDVFENVWFLRHQKKEVLRALYLNQDNKLIHSCTISSGKKDSVIFYAKDIFRIALICNASGVILVHNHPSGNITPSKEDLEITDTLLKIGKVIGIQFVDHVIVTSTEYKSLLKS